MRKTRALAAVAGVALLLGLLGLGQVAGAATRAPAPTVRVLKLDGVVDPFMASYLTRNIHAADDAHQAAVLIEIDTPGGLDSSMRSITKAIISSSLDASVPVLCWTGPSGGARAASAGTFIMLACPWNAMAPGTEIGAAHPVGVSGAIEQAKVSNDAASYLQSLARDWGRDAAWARDAVLNSQSLSAEEAVNRGVADFLASSPRDFLNQVDGKTTAPHVTGALMQRPVAHVKGATLVNEPMGIGAGLLHSLVDPNLAFIFFYAGIILLVVELLHPGISVPGVAGTLLLVISIVSLGMLPVQLGGLILLVASAVLYLLELKHPGIGLPAIGGTICLVLGGLLLFDPSVPNARVSRWLLLVVPTVLVAFFGFVAQAVLEARRLPPLQQPVGDLMLGAQGMALDDLDPRGRVWVGHETWSAESVAGPIPKGTPVRVVRRAGLTLLVEPAVTVSSSHQKETES